MGSARNYRVCYVVRKRAAGTELASLLERVGTTEEASRRDCPAGLDWQTVYQECLWSQVCVYVVVCVLRALEELQRGGQHRLGTARPKTFWRPVRCLLQLTRVR